MQKENNLFSIGEIAKSLGITRRIILNYEEKGLIKPDVKRGDNGNRYYTVDTMTTIHTIRIFQKHGLSLDEIQSYLEGTTDLIPLIHHLESIRDEINVNIEKLYERAHGYTEQIKEVLLEEQTVYRCAYHTASIEEKTNLLRDVALAALHQYGTDTSQRLYSIEYSLTSPEDIFCCAAVPPKSQGEHVIKLSPAPTLSIYYHGAYEGLSAARDQLLAYAKKNGYTLLGTCRHIYLEGPPQHKDKSLFITQVALPILP